jgi:general secretion pathway protein K
MRTERGLALVTALLIVSVVSVLAIGLSYSGALNFKRVETQTRLAQMRAYAQGLEGIALKVLSDDQRYAAAKDYPAEEWARGLPPLPVEGGMLGGKLIDLSGRFNLNALDASNPDAPLARERFARLLVALKLNPNVLPALVDFIDADDDPTPGGAEDSQYARLEPPTRAANRPLVHVSELKRLIGCDVACYARLEPLIATLDPRTPLNINAAPVEVIVSLSSEMREAQAKTLALFQQNGYESADMFVARARDLGVSVLPTQLGATSGYFLAEATVLLNGHSQRFESMIDRSGGSPRVVWRR